MGEGEREKKKEIAGKTKKIFRLEYFYFVCVFIHMSVGQFLLGNFYLIFFFCVGVKKKKKNENVVDDVVVVVVVVEILRGTVIEFLNCFFLR